MRGGWVGELDYKEQEQEKDPTWREMPAFSTSSLLYKCKLDCLGASMINSRRGSYSMREGLLTKLLASDMVHGHRQRLRGEEEQRPRLGLTA
eukprot:scaffold4342_cov166-Ochromonas_danica.AAC.3